MFRPRIWDVDEITYYFLTPSAECIGGLGTLAYPARDVRVFKAA
jgi:hypothetical protein